MCDQPSWQHAPADAAVTIPRHGLMPALWDRALQDADQSADAVINFGYDWLPLWITPHVSARLCSSDFDGGCGGGDAGGDRSRWPPGIPVAWLFTPVGRRRTFTCLPAAGGGQWFRSRQLSAGSGQTNGPLGWAGRIAPEKGLEDAAAAAAALGERLLVWGIREDDAYARQVEASSAHGHDGLAWISSDPGALQENWAVVAR